jgi:hypothetical protein
MSPLWPCHLPLKKVSEEGKKEELWKLKYFTIQKTEESSENPLNKRPKSFKDIL